MFAEWLKAVKDAKATLAQAQTLLDKATVANAQHARMVAELAKAKEGNLKYKKENEFLKHKLKHSAEKLNKELESNTNLFASVKLAQSYIFPEIPSAATNEDKRSFLV